MSNQSTTVTDISESVVEEQSTKKQKLEEKEEPVPRVLENDFYVNNFGRGSRFYELLKEAQDRVNLIYEKYADDAEDFECTEDGLADFESKVPMALAHKIGKILHIVGEDYPKIDAVLLKRNEKKSKNE